MDKQKACSSPLHFFFCLTYCAPLALPTLPLTISLLVSLVAWPPQGSPASGWESGEIKWVLGTPFLACVLSSAGLFLIGCTNAY